MYETTFNMEKLTGVATEIIPRVDANLWQPKAGSADEGEDEEKFLLHGDEVSDGLSLLQQPQALYHRLLLTIPLPQRFLSVPQQPPRFLSATTQG